MLPIVELPAEQFGPLGITVSETEAGGGNGQGAATLPAVKVRWADQRQWCRLVHDWLEAGADPEAQPQYEACGSYRSGTCGGNGHGALCLFLEDADGPAWAKARRWRRVDGGLIFIGD